MGFLSVVVDLVAEILNASLSGAKVWGGATVAGIGLAIALRNLNLIKGPKLTGEYKYGAMLCAAMATGGVFFVAALLSLTASLMHFDAPLLYLGAASTVFLGLWFAKKVD